MMNSRMILFFLGVFVTTNSIVLASDPNPLQDFCVADINNPVRMNGYACKSPENVLADDFYFSGILTPRSTDNFLGTNVTLVSVDKIVGLNTLGICMGRVDYAPGGVNPPHEHPRGSEILTVIEGSLLAGFVSSNHDGNRLFSKVLNKGDVFVFPQGMVHFQKNIGDGNAAAIAMFSSQSPGFETIGNTVFGSTPKIPTDILATAFQTDPATIWNIQAKF